MSSGIIRCDGKPVCLGWHEHELLWLRAAIDNGCNPEDFADIAAMSGRTPEAVRDKAYQIRRADHMASHRAAVARASRAALARAKPVATPIIAPIRALTAAELMSGVASKRPSHFRDALRGFA